MRSGTRGHSLQSHKWCQAFQDETSEFRAGGEGGCNYCGVVMAVSSSLGVSSYGGKWKGLEPQSLVLAGLTHGGLLDSPLV